MRSSGPAPAARLNSTAPAALPLTDCLSWRELRVPGPDSLIIAPSLIPAWPPLLAYGPFPGIELIPYFLGLVVWMGLAFAAFLFSPITALLRRLRRGRVAPVAESNAETPPQPLPEPPG